MAKNAGDLSLPANRANYLKTLYHAGMANKRVSNLMSQSDVFKGFSRDEVCEIVRAFPDPAKEAESIPKERLNSAKLLVLDSIAEVRQR